MPQEIQVDISEFTANHHDIEHQQANITDAIFVLATGINRIAKALEEISDTVNGTPNNTQEEIK